MSRFLLQNEIPESKKTFEINDKLQKREGNCLHNEGEYPFLQKMYVLYATLGISYGMMNFPILFIH